MLSDIVVISVPPSRGEDPPAESNRRSAATLRNEPPAEPETPFRCEAASRAADAGGAVLRVGELRVERGRSSFDLPR